MQTDLVTKTLLSVIATLLAILVVRPDFTPSPSYAAKPIEYKVISQKVETFPELEAALNSYGSEGWELVSFGIGPMVFKR
jgi:hypothetical protein